MKKRRIAIIIGVIFLVAVAVGLAMLFMQPSEVRHPMVFASNDERVRLAADVDRRATIFSRALRNRRGNRASLDVSEKELNAYIQTSPEIQRKLEELGAQDVAVKLHKDRVVVGLRLPFKGAMLPASAIIEVRQAPGRKLVVNIASMKVGSFPAPRAMVDRITSSALKSGSLNLPPGFTGVSVDEGKFTLEANPQSITGTD